MPNEVYTMIIPMAILLVGMYFLSVRPENKKRKAAEEMRRELAIGDDITTVGGLMGKIVNIREDSVTFETGEDRVRIEVMKAAVNKAGKEEKSE